MSRIGKLPVNLPAGVTVTVSPDNVVSVKGPLGTLSQKVDSDITVTVEGNEGTSPVRPISPATVRCTACTVR